MEQTFSITPELNFLIKLIPFVFIAIILMTIARLMFNMKDTEDTENKDATSVNVFSFKEMYHRWNKKKFKK